MGGKEFRKAGGILDGQVQGSPFCSQVLIYRETESQIFAVSQPAVSPSGTFAKPAAS